MAEKVIDSIGHLTPIHCRLSSMLVLTTTTTTMLLLLLSSFSPSPLKYGWAMVKWLPPFWQKVNCSCWIGTIELICLCGKLMKLNVIECFDWYRWQNHRSWTNSTHHWYSCCWSPRLTNRPMHEHWTCKTMHKTNNGHNTNNEDDDVLWSNEFISWTNDWRRFFLCVPNAYRIIEARIVWIIHLAFLH